MENHEQKVQLLKRPNGTDKKCQSQNLPRKPPHRQGSFVGVAAWVQNRYAIRAVLVDFEMAKQCDTRSLNWFSTDLLYRHCRAQMARATKCGMTFIMFH